MFSAALNLLILSNNEICFAVMDLRREMVQADILLETQQPDDRCKIE